MFNSFSFSELLTILVVIVIVFGPNKLPEMARRLGQWTATARRSIDSLKDELGTEYKDVIDPIRDARNEVRGIRRELGETARSVVSDLDDAAAEVRSNVDPSDPLRSLTHTDLEAAAAGPSNAEDTAGVAEVTAGGDTELSSDGTAEPPAPTTGPGEMPLHPASLKERMGRVSAAPADGEASTEDSGAGEAAAGDAADETSEEA